MLKGQRSGVMLGALVAVFVFNERPALLAIHIAGGLPGGSHGGLDVEHFSAARAAP